MSRVCRTQDDRISQRVSEPGLGQRRAAPTGAEHALLDRVWGEPPPVKAILLEPLTRALAPCSGQKC